MQCSYSITHVWSRHGLCETLWQHIWPCFPGARSPPLTKQQQQFQEGFGIGRGHWGGVRRDTAYPVGSLPYAEGLQVGLVVPIAVRWVGMLSIMQEQTCISS